MWSDKLKEAGVSIHVIATGGGAGLQQELWKVPGSSAYLSGASFPYSTEEQVELLGFTPEHFCSEDAAIDLASAAYMKAFNYGGKKPVGLGITATVASEKEHRGDHRVHACIITDDKVLTYHYKLIKGVGEHRRYLDGGSCDDVGFYMLLDTLGVGINPEGTTAEAGFHMLHCEDATEKALARFMLRPVFLMDGKRYPNLDSLSKFGLMPGAFNPPHEGHFGMADSFYKETNIRPVFEISAKTPHKEPLKVQDMLKRAKMLRGRDVIFTVGLPYYLDKAKAYPGKPFVVGADAMVRMLDPKWGMDITDMLYEFLSLKTKFYVAERLINGKEVEAADIVEEVADFLTEEYDETNLDLAYDLIEDLEGRWDISSTDIRNKAK